MSDDAVPDDIRRFVLTAIPSVPYLEAVLQFHRQPGLPRSAEDISRAIYVSQPVAAELLQAMCEAGVLSEEGGRFRYTPDPLLAEVLARLAVVYATHLIAVTELIHDSTQRSAERFAEAFRMRRRN